MIRICPPRGARSQNHAANAAPADAIFKIREPGGSAKLNQAILAQVFSGAEHSRVRHLRQIEALAQFVSRVAPFIVRNAMTISCENGQADRTWPPASLAKMALAASQSLRFLL
jgi:hypothetical protein